MTLRKEIHMLMPWTRKGYELLDRYDSSSPATGDLKVLEQMRAHGADLSKPRHVVHYFYFPNDSARTKAEQKLLALGYEVSHSIESEGSEPTSLIAERVGRVDEHTVSEERDNLTGIAEEQKGEYNGWEAALD
ncbi:MAG: ribonuclease E inhibitor RraB [Acidobacteriaceae bacterium]|nr:ribonuclease E inhibitor RraB [Acidobacteriaceae bacterium]